MADQRRVHFPIFARLWERIIEPMAKARGADEHRRKLPPLPPPAKLCGQPAAVDAQESQGSPGGDEQRRGKVADREACWRSDGSDPKDNLSHDGPPHLPKGERARLTAARSILSTPRR
jgi:hypothetical protein